MPLTVNTNIPSLKTQRSLEKSSKKLNISLQKLSSGLRINSAKDDAAGLAISDRMTSQIRGLSQAIRNANDGISLAQTAERALQEDVKIIHRMRELALQSSNATLTSSDRKSLDEEFQQLKQEYNRIAQDTEFNGLKLLDGSFFQKEFQVGANPRDAISLSIPALCPILPTPDKTVSPTSPTLDGIDLVFLLDTTGSMGTALNELRTEITTVINGLQARTNDLSVGVIAYSNIYPGNTETFALAEMDSVGEAQLNDFLINLAEGGGTEMLGQALQEASSLAWDETVNQVILVLGSSGDEADDPDVALQVAKEFSNSSSLRTVSSISANGSSSFFQDLAKKGGGKYDTYTEGNLINVIGNISNEVIVSPEPTPPPEPEEEEPTFYSIDLLTVDDAQEAIPVLDDTLTKVDNIRTDLGAVVNRMEHSIANLHNISENLLASRSRILDTDIAKETSEMTRQNILQQAGVSILAQAGQQPQLILSLLQG